MFPTNALDQEGGVNVLDMADPTHPALTARLVTPAMDTPHESLVLSQNRGLLVAVAGNLATNVGQIDIYDISKDCRHPELKSTTPLGLLGPRERPGARRSHVLLGLAVRPDARGRRHLRIPCCRVPIWFGNYDSHGLSISDDGNRAYVAGVDSRTDHPRHLRGPGARRPTRRSRGRPPPVELDEHPAERDPDHDQGAPVPRRDRRVRRPVRGRRGPHHRHRRRDAAAGCSRTCAWRCTSRRTSTRRPTTTARRTRSRATPATTATCPTRVDPTIVACSMILSGLRVFDIRDPAHPREIAYFNAPVTPRILPPVGVIRRRATGRCRARRLCPSATRSGTRTG